MDHKVGLVLKASGWNPRPNANQNPDPHEYGESWVDNPNTDAEAILPKLQNFPIAHPEFFKGARDAAALIRKAWSGGYSVVIHDNDGRSRATVAACYLLWKMTNLNMVFWLQELSAVRCIGRPLEDFLQETRRADRMVNPDDEQCWVPCDNYREFALICRLWD